MPINIEDYNGKALTIERAEELWGGTLTEIAAPEGLAEQKIRGIQPYGSILMDISCGVGRESTISFTWDKPYPDTGEDPLLGFHL